MVRKAELCRLTGDSEQAIALYRRLIAQARQDGRPEQATEYYKLALAIAPEDRTLRHEKAEFKLDIGQIDSALNDFFSLADTCLAHDDIAEGMAILDRIAALASDDLDKRLRIGRCLERNGRQEEAYASYGVLVRDLPSARKCAACDPRPCKPSGSSWRPSWPTTSRPKPSRLAWPPPPSARLTAI